MLVYLFGNFINMSISASWVALAILLVRRMFSKRLPTLFAYFLWGIVLFRFVVPISFPAIFSGLHFAGGRVTSAGPGGMAVAVHYLEPGEMPMLASGGNGAVLWQVFASVWAAGAALCLLVGIIGYRDICRQADTAFVIRDNAILAGCSRRVGLRRVPPLFYSGTFSSPVIVGLLHPRILLPDSLDLSDEARLRHILIHECVHLRRFDHITKALFSLVLCLHWFNPLCWLCCMLFDRDVEASCDERALSLLGESEKANYARSLVALSTVQQSFLRRRIAFSESSLHARVMNIARYRPLTRWRQIVLSGLLLCIGLVTVTNPMRIPDVFRPRSYPVSGSAMGRFEALAKDLTDALDRGDADALLALSPRSDAYYRPLYAGLSERPLSVRDSKIYPQSENLAYSYLTTEDDARYVAVIRDDTLTALQPKELFEAAQLVDRQDEAVRLIKNLHRFGILEGIAEPNTLPRPAVAMLCIDEVYRDKLAAGTISPEEVFLSPDEIAQAASDYFGLANFAYTFDPELYDADLQAYIYAPDRGGQYDVEILSLEHGESHTTVTAVVYSDPLHMIPQSEITYTLQKREIN